MPGKPSATPGSLAGAIDSAVFRRALLDWFADNARDLPWRRTLDPYHVWLSEIMLQQTQMDRAVGYFERFLERFPDIASLDAAGEDEVLKLCEGLGYYSRARNLRKAARLVMERHGGAFPRAIQDIRALPGVGPYTAGAIASVAYNEPLPAVDANVLRVFARLLDLDEPVDLPAVKRCIEAAVVELLDPLDARGFNQALMELGALVCAPRSPRCPACPRSVLPGAVAGTQETRPVLRPVHAVIAKHGLCVWPAVDGYLQKRRPGRRLAGLWGVPRWGGEEGETPEEALVREVREGQTSTCVVRHVRCGRSISPATASL